MEQYAVVNYDGHTDNDNQVEIKYVTDNFDYANKLAFHYAKQGFLPKLGVREYKILKDYYHDFHPIYLRDVIVEYRIGEVKYDDERKTYEIIDVYKMAWSVVKIYNNNTEKVEDIDEKVIYEC